MAIDSIQHRKSIHDREPLQSEESTQNYENQNSSRSESDEECEKTTTNHKKTHKDHKVTRKQSCPPSQHRQKTSEPIIINNKTGLNIKLVYILLCVSIVWLLFQKKQQICSFENFKNEYPNENGKVWNQLKIGIEMILNKRTENPGVYLLAHHDNESSAKLVVEIAEHSAKCFGKKLVPMQDDDFLQDDYGRAIEKYKSKIKDGDVFLIADLNKIPARAARAFHTICDTHSPIRKNVVIFLALAIDKNKEGNDHAIAEETLKELWGAEVDRYELDPLITRVTDQVIILNS